MKMKGGKLVNDCRPKNEETTNEAKKCWPEFTRRKELKNYSAKHTTAASKRKT